MMFAVPSEEYEVNETFGRAVETLLILHADHEQNCSTSTMRMVGSSRANIYSSASAAIMALWGPLHGGANQAVIEMLHDIAEHEGSGRAFLQKAKDSNDTTRLMGFGHRVYKNFDPRAKILKEHAHDVLDELGSSPRLLEIAIELEQLALEDDYFVSRRLYPNVDFYSGIIYEALGIPATASRRSSPSAGCPAGSPTGVSTTPTRRPSSAGRARSTSARRSATTWRSRSEASRRRSGAAPAPARPTAHNKGGRLGGAEASLQPADRAARRRGAAAGRRTARGDGR